MPRMGQLSGRIAGLCLSFALLLPLACNSGSQSSPGGSTNSPDAAAIKAIYQARADAMRDYDSSAYLATFSTSFVNTNVTGRTVANGPSEYVKDWPKQGLVAGIGSLANRLSGQYDLPEVLNVKSNGDNTAVATVVWHETSHSVGRGGRRYYYFHDYVCNDKWEKVSGHWVQKSSQYTQDRQWWSLEPIPDSARKISP